MEKKIKKVNNIKKKNFRISLISLDFITLLIIFFFIFLLFEIVIKNILINYNVDKFYEKIETTQFDTINSITYLEEKTDLDYNKSAREIFDYLKISSLKRANYDNSIFMAVFPNDKYNIVGKKNKLSLAYDDPTINYYYLENLSMNDTTGDAENNIVFKYSGRKYIGIYAKSNIGVRNDFKRTGEKLIYPYFILADQDDEFFFLINKIRNVFFILLIIVFTLGLFIKTVITSKAIKEIYIIRDKLRKENEEMLKQGIISKVVSENKMKFTETSDLNNAFNESRKALLNVGEIISGIADNDLFIATLKKDNSILNQHDVMMSVIFLDIRGFTSITEKHKDNAMKIVNFIWGEAGKIIKKNDGKINKYIGDACLIIFPENKQKNQHLSGVKAFFTAVEILKQVPNINKKLNSLFNRNNDPDKIIDFNFRIGFDCGIVTMGKTGTDDNYELGVIGDAVNTASRFEALNKQYHTNLLMTDGALERISIGLIKTNRDEKYKYFSQINNLLFEKHGLTLLKIDKARPKGKKEPKDMITVILRDNTELFSFIGDNVKYNEKLIPVYMALYKNFQESINVWKPYMENKNSGVTTEELEKIRNKAVNHWFQLSKNFAKLYFQEKFPLCEQFLKTLLKFDEFEKCLKDYDNWKMKKIGETKEPSIDWIKYGSIELDK